MKSHVLRTGVAVIISGLMVGVAGAQEAQEQENRPSRNAFLRMIPVIAALDSDEDGILSAEEIADATKSLTTLDKDEDGTLSIEEMQPTFNRQRRRDPANADRADSEEGQSRRRRNRDRTAFTPPTAESLVDRAMEFDKDEDGVLSKEELKAMYEERMQRFPRGNRNSDGENERPDRPRRPE